jgi:hypothetical protein
MSRLFSTLIDKRYYKGLDLKPTSPAYLKRIAEEQAKYKIKCIELFRTIPHIRVQDLDSLLNYKYLQNLEYKLYMEIYKILLDKYYPRPNFIKRFWFWMTEFV